LPKSTLNPTLFIWKIWQAPLCKELLNGSILARQQEMISDSLRNLRDQGYLRQVILASSSQAISHHPPDKYTLHDQQRAGQGGSKQ
jgi:hypothetical protein